jgi:hypothetical protein
MSPSRELQSEDTLHLAYAEASMMLIESLTRLLIERHLLSLEDVIETFETAIETKRQMTAEGKHPEVSRLAAGVMAMVANSLAATGPGGK